MTKEEYTNVIEQLRTTTDDGEKSTLLLSLTNDYNAMLADSEAQKEKITKLETNNKTLADANNKLWLERSTVTTPEPEPEPQPTPPQKRTFADLEKLFD